MAYKFIPGNAPSYQALKSDMNSASKIDGVGYVGADVWFSDTNEWYRVLEEGVLAPVSSQVVSPEVVYDVNSMGQIYISSSLVSVSGSTLNVSNRNGFMLKSHPSNSSGVITFYANSGSISGSAGGFPLAVGDQTVFSGSNLNMLNYAIRGASSGCLCWMKI